MDTLPLPTRANLEQYKKRAKDLVKAAKSADPGAVRVWATEWLQAIASLLNVEITPFVQDSFDRALDHIEALVREKQKSVRPADGFTLADAQFLIAEAHGFQNWPAFASHIENLSKSSGDEFEQAADAVVDGDITTLRALLERNPELIRARSKRVHRATLLHYVAANGVEDFRQKTPPNAVDVAKLLLDAGAEVDAIAETYGGGKAQTTMNLLVSSVHPNAAGLQGSLAATLLDYGAAINGLEDNSSPLLTALAFNYPDSARTLAERGARVETLVAAAALGRIDDVKAFVAGTRRLEVPKNTPYWIHIPADRKGQLELALVWACKFGQAQTAEFLLEHGVAVTAKDNDSMTALHWAAAGGFVEIVKALLARGAPLEVKNDWGGTVLDSTGYFVRQEPPDSVNYVPVVEALLAAGANPKAVSPFPLGNHAVDDLLRRHGA